MTRPPPKFAPLIEPGAPAGPCAECGAPGPHDQALRHLQAVLGGTRPVMVASRCPLCTTCAAAARHQGWLALPVAWRGLVQAPNMAAALAGAECEGGRQ